MELMKRIQKKKVIYNKTMKFSILMILLINQVKRLIKITLGELELLNKILEIKTSKLRKMMQTIQSHLKIQVTEDLA